MGLWGQLRATVTGKPKTPTARPFEADPYYDYRAGKEGKGTLQGREASEAAFGLLQKYLARAPGFSDEEQKAMYDIPAEQTKLQEQGALRRLNQTSAATGRFGSGGTGAGRAAIMEGGIRGRAGLKQNVLVMAAQAALEDRIRQIQAADDFAMSRMGMTRGAAEGRNIYNMGLNNLDLAKYRTNLDQYNYDRAKGEEMIQKIIMAAMGGCWVAEAIFGVEAETTKLARFYVNELADPAFKRWYLDNGEELAGLVKRDRRLRGLLAPLFIAFANRAKRFLEDSGGDVPQSAARA